MATIEEERLLKLFNYKHLPDSHLPHQSAGDPTLRQVSQQFHAVAHWLVENMPRTPERSKALNSLFDAKNNAVAALLPDEVV